MLNHRYHHLAYGERCQIQGFLKSGMSLREIGRLLNRSASTVSREVRRNSGRRGYRMKQAQRLASARRRKASSALRKMTRDMWELVREKLSLQWSPEQIAGRFRREGVVSVSASWIYRHIGDDRDSGGTLFEHLRRRGKKYNRRAGNGAGRGVIADRVDISRRPAEVENKKRVGDWELDTIVGSRHRGAVVSLVDRASKYTFLELVRTKASAEVNAAIRRCLKPVSPLVHTLTADNGKEFSGHREIAEALAARFFFATPYHSWERGLNEHTNGLVRQYFPKSTNFREVELGEMLKVEGLLNNRPRKVLGFRTPAEVFGRALAAVGLGGSGDT